MGLRSIVNRQESPELIVEYSTSITISRGIYNTRSSVFDGNHTMPTRQADWPTLIVTYVCSCLALKFILIRLVCRRMRGERYMSFHDDMWMGISAVPLLLRLGLIHVVIVNGTNAISMETARSLDGEALEGRVLGSKLVLASRISYSAL